MVESSKSGLSMDRDSLNRILPEGAELGIEHSSGTERPNVITELAAKKAADTLVVYTVKTTKEVDGHGSRSGGHGHRRSHKIRKEVWVLMHSKMLKTRQSKDFLQQYPIRVSLMRV